MHEWHSNTSTNILSLINEFIGFKFSTEYCGNETVSDVRILNRIFNNETEARSYVTRSSYGSNTAYLVAYTTKKVSKAYQNAFDSFITKNKEYEDFDSNLTIGYGRKSLKVTCPNCQSSISLNYGKRFRVCPICGSKKIISESNWKALDTKKKLVEKAAVVLSKEAEKNNVTFICGFEWHC